MLVGLAILMLAAACEGGPPNGHLTVKNDTDRPVLWVGDASLTSALETRRFLQYNTELDPGEKREVGLPRPPGVPRTGREPWCMVAIEFWVITSNNDDPTDFEAPIDPESVTVEEHLVGACWSENGDTYVIE